MEQPAITQMAGRANQMIDAYGRFLRQTLERVWPHESSGTLDDLEQEACRQFGAALEHRIESDPLALYQIAVTTTLQTVRRYKQRHAAQAVAWVDLDDSAPITAAERPEITQRIRAAIARLPDHRRRAVGLQITGLTEPEISELLGWSEAKVRKEIERGLRTLRAALREAGIEYESN